MKTRKSHLAIWLSDVAATALALAALCASAQAVSAGEVCNDGIDNDLDGKIDYEDSDCKPAGTTYYVSSSSGNDHWDGLAPEWKAGKRGPKRSDAAIELLLGATKPGDAVLLKRGDVWHISNGLSVSNAVGAVGPASTIRPVIFGAYGIGALPRIIREVPGANGPAVLVWRSSRHLILENLAISSAYPGTTGIELSEADPAWQEPQDITIRNCLIEANDNGIAIVDSLDNLDMLSDVVVENCVIRNNFIAGTGRENASKGIYVAAYNVTLRGNLFENNGYSENGFSWQAYVQCRSNIRIEGNEFRDSYTGVKIGRMQGAIVRDNHFYDIDTTAITVGGDEGGPSTNVIIDRNHIYRCGDGLVVKEQNEAGKGYTDGLIVRNNLFYDNNSYAGDLYPNAYVIVKGTTPVMYGNIYNNVFFDIQEDKCLVIEYHADSDVSVRNNIFWKEAWDDVPAIADSLGADIAFNLFSLEEISFGSDAIIGEPWFQNTLERDFHLTALSVSAIDQGSDAAGIVDDDADGNHRPNGGGWDIGAYEYFEP